MEVAIFLLYNIFDKLQQLSVLPHVMFLCCTVTHRTCIHMAALLALLGCAGCVAAFPHKQTATAVAIHWNEVLACKDMP